jgi:uncharacterized integral membrane protein
MSTPDRPPKERALVPKTIAALAVAFLLIAFGLSNRNDVPINWLVGTTDTPLIAVVVVSAVLGAILGALAVRGRSKRRAGSRDASRAASPSHHGGAGPELDDLELVEAVLVDHVARGRDLEVLGAPAHLVARPPRGQRELLAQQPVERRHVARGDGGLKLALARLDLVHAPTVPRP